VLVIVAVFMVGLIVVMALGVDIGNARQTQRNLQSAADAGALAGAQQLNQSTGVTPTTYAADYSLDSLNQPRVATPSCAGAPAGEPPTATAATTCYPFGGNGFVYVTTPWAQDDQPTGGCGAFCPGPAANQEVNVKICQTVATSLARVINITSLRTCKSSTSGIFGSISAQYALFANSTCGHGIIMNASNLTISGVIRTNGDFDQKGTNNTLGPTYYGPTASGCQFIPDQTSGDTYNGLSAPISEAVVPDPCVGPPYSTACDSSVFPSACTDTGDSSILPGNPVNGHVYCITDTNNLNITLTNYTGSNTFYVHGGAKLNFKCNGTCNLSPAATGGGFLVDLQGFNGGCTSDVVNNNGGGSLTLSGTIWAPGGHVNLNLAATLNGFIDACTINVNNSVNGNGPVTQIANTTTPALIR
jgi:Flp pilus assembly protein TadG